MATVSKRTDRASLNSASRPFSGLLVESVGQKCVGMNRTARRDRGRLAEFLKHLADRPRRQQTVAIAAARELDHPVRCGGVRRDHPVELRARKDQISRHREAGPIALDPERRREQLLQRIDQADFRVATEIAERFVHRAPAGTLDEEALNPGPLANQDQALQKRPSEYEIGSSRGRANDDRLYQCKISGKPGLGKDAFVKCRLLDESIRLVNALQEKLIH